MSDQRVPLKSKNSEGFKPLGLPIVDTGRPDKPNTIPPKTPPVAQLLKAIKRTIGIYFLASVFLSAVITAASGRLPPIAVGGALLGALLLIGCLLFARSRKQNRGSQEPIESLRRELDHSRRSYQHLFTAVPNFICVLNRNHEIIEANALYRSEFGCEDRSLCYEVCKKRTSQCPDCQVDETFVDGQIHSSEETLVTRDGRRISAVVYTQPVFDHDGEISAVMEVFTDITEVKQLQRQLALTGRAVAGMAHRVKNILMGLEGGIFIVNEGLETNDRKSIDEGWEMVERNVHKVSGIVKDLLYCSKERQPKFSADVCPHDIVLDVRDLFVSRMEGESIDILTELKEPRHRGTFDADGIHNLLCNLVANAIDACRFDPSEDKERHAVTLRCRQKGDGSTVLEVEDDGAGIPEDLNSKVFQDFFSSKGTEGTGIGLLVVQKVAEEHGGGVTFESEPGKGTVFTVVIPGDFGILLAPASDTDQPHPHEA